MLPHERRDTVALRSVTRSSVNASRSFPGIVRSTYAFRPSLKLRSSARQRARIQATPHVCIGKGDTWIVDTQKMSNEGSTIVERPQYLLHHAKPS